jgi:hypothetical protein
MRCCQGGRCAKWVLSLSDDRHSHPIDAGILDPDKVTRLAPQTSRGADLESAWAATDNQW